jgi:hypothetical protein
MGAPTWAIPVGVLSGICAAGLIFIWWWFPRTWAKGVKAEMEAIDEDRRVRDAHRTRQLDAEGAVGGDAGDGATQVEGMTGEGGTATTLPPQAKFVYTPPAYTAY